MARDFLRQLPKGNNARTFSLLSWLCLDPWLFFLLLVLSCAGLTVLHSASDGDWLMLKRQMIFMGFGYLMMMVVARIPQMLVKQVSPFLYLFSIALLVLVMFFGTGAKGAQRWLDLPLLPRFQPSELVKLALPVFLARYFQHQILPPKFQHIVLSLFIIGLPTILILEQPDLGTSILIALSGLVVLFVAGLAWRYILAAFVLLAMAVPVMWFYVLHDYQRQRVLTLLNPEADKWGAGWNIIQSTTAIGAGGVSGKGWQLGTQSHLHFLPESHTDFIIAVLAEEFGYIGVVALLSINLMIVGRGFWIAAHAPDVFGRLLASSITFIYFVYLFVNMGMVSGILPVVGVPLPLVSQGGTSIVTLLCGFGMLMSIATGTRRMNQS
ncbi:MAG: rod shape-determining protein RodA [Pseudomonadales bacterium]|nr:rod shape-determining protein RodA [Pseudomonadales bacterium]